jgi:hypothetical protein
MPRAERAFLAETVADVTEDGDGFPVVTRGLLVLAQGRSAGPTPPSAQA